MRKRKRDEYDYKTFGEKVYDFAFKHRIKIILISFIYSLIIFIVSWMTNNNEGLYVVILYPLALIIFIVEFFIIKGGLYRYSTLALLICTMIAETFLFIHGFFV